MSIHWLLWLLVSNSWIGCISIFKQANGPELSCSLLASHQSLFGILPCLSSVIYASPPSQLLVAENNLLSKRKQNNQIWFTLKHENSGGVQQNRHGWTHSPPPYWCGSLILDADGLVFVHNLLFRTLFLLCILLRGFHNNK